MDLRLSKGELTLEKKLDIALLWPRAYEYK